MVLRQLVVHGLSDSTKALMDIDRKKSQIHPVCDHCGIVVIQGRVYSKLPHRLAHPNVLDSLTWVLKPAMSARMVATLLSSASTAITAVGPATIHLHIACTPSW